MPPTGPAATAPSRGAAAPGRIGTPATGAAPAAGPPISAPLPEPPAPSSVEYCPPISSAAVAWGLNTMAATPKPAPAII
ncbi:hypothetical protein CFE69_00640 [Mycobacteroides abscessus subsp. massiliense]|nr:hypothetical protein CFE69_00640 [Mycobacteroides abscessus subsp. massiliense]